MDNQFVEICSQKSDTDLLEILDNPFTYIPEMILAALAELKKRNVPFETNLSLSQYLEEYDEDIEEEKRNSEIQNSDKIKFEKLLGGQTVRFIIRIITVVIDFILIMIGAFALTYINNLYFPFRLNFLWTFILVSFLYEVPITCSSLQATPGKLLFGLKVVDIDGAKISFGKASVRHISKWFSGAIFGLGYIAILFDKKKRTWHDKISLSFVIKPFQRNANDEILLDKDVTN